MDAPKNPLSKRKRKVELAKVLIKKRLANGDTDILEFINSLAEQYSEAGPAGDPSWYRRWGTAVKNQFIEFSTTLIAKVIKEFSGR